MGVHCRAGHEDFVTACLVRTGEIKPKDLKRPEFQGCGLRMKVPLPDEYPPDFPEKQAIEKLRELTLEEAIRRWNRRSENNNS